MKSILFQQEAQGADVQNHLNDQDFERDQVNPGALLNKNNAALDGYKKTKAAMRRLNTIDELSNRMDRIEKLLMELLSK